MRRTSTARPVLCPARPRARRALTMVELLVASGLLAAVVVLFWALLSTARREGARVEERSELMDAAVLLQEALAWDLRRALDLGVLPPEDRVRGEARPEVVLPLYAGYDGRDEPARRYRARRYRFEAATGRLLRGEDPLVLEGLREARFTWSARGPAELVVELVGEAAAGGEAARFEFRLPAPPGTDPAALWVRHPRHAGATPVLAAAEEDELGVEAAR